MTEEADRRLAARLHHIGLGAPDPDALAAFYGKAMGLELSHTPEGLLGKTGGRALYFVPGPRKTLAFAGFAVDAPEQLDALAHRLRRTSVGHSVLAAGTTLFAPGALSLADPDGNKLLFGLVREGVDDQTVAGLPARLQHCVVASRDAARLSRFYQQSLGFVLSDNVVDEAGDLRAAFLRCGREHHSFAVFQASQDRFDHHCYEAGAWDLIRDWADHFAAIGTPVVWGPGRHGPGNNLFLFVHDPDGNWLEISAELELVAPDRPAGEWPHVQSTLNRWGSAPLRS